MTVEKAIEILECNRVVHLGGRHGEILSASEIIDLLRGMPTSPILCIRCKDCKHYMTTGAFGTPLRKEDYWCDAENFPDEGQKELPEWWFCAGAERKDAT